MVPRSSATTTPAASSEATHHGPDTRELPQPVKDGGDFDPQKPTGIDPLPKQPPGSVFVGVWPRRAVAGGNSTAPWTSILPRHTVLAEGQAIGVVYKGVRS